MKAILFPGQGSQRKGMGADLFARFPGYVSIANEILGYDLARVCLDDPGGKLRQTLYTQPAVFLVSALSYLARNEAGEALPDRLAGHSIGEFAALLAAGVFSFEDAIRLVKARAELMSQADGGGLAALIGHDERATEALICAAAIPGIEIANINTPDQTVVGGPAQELERFTIHCEEAGARLIPLPVSGAFHTSWMDGPARAFAELLDKTPVRPPLIPVIANVTGAPYGDDIRATLARQMNNPVRWSETIARLHADGVSAFEDCPTGGPLLKMVDAVRNSLPRPLASNSGGSRAKPRAGTGANIEAPARSANHTAEIAGGAGTCATLNHSFAEAISASPFVIGWSCETLLDTTTAKQLATASHPVFLPPGKALGLPATRNIGLALQYDPFVGRDEVERLLGRALAHGITLFDLHGFPAVPKPLAQASQASQAAAPETGGGKAPGPPVFSILRANSKRLLDHLLALPEGARPDAICIDLSRWRSRAAPALDHALEALSHRDAATTAKPFRIPFIGIASMPRSAQDALELIALGFDFADVASLLSVPRRTPAPRRNTAAAAATPHDIERYPGTLRTLLDWSVPETGARTLCWLPDASIAAWFESAETLYRRKEPDPAEAEAMISALAAAVPEGTSLKTAAAIADGSARARLRAFANEAFKSLAHPYGSGLAITRTQTSQRTTAARPVRANTDELAGLAPPTGHSRLPPSQAGVLTQ